MTDADVDWHLISEEIRPVPGSIDATGMAVGEPGVPLRLTWRGQAYDVAEVRERWKTTAREGGRATGETYVRRHYVDLRTTSGERMVIYCDRQLRRGQSRWWLYRLAEDRAP